MPSIIDWGVSGGGRETSGKAASPSGKRRAWLMSSVFATPDLLPGSLRRALSFLLLQERKLRHREVNLPAQGPSQKEAEVGFEPRPLNTRPAPLSAHLAISEERDRLCSFRRALVSLICNMG